MSTASALDPPRYPGDLAMWLFILAELLVFGVFFLAYAFARQHHLALFEQGQAGLNPLTGVVHTVALLSGGYAVVRAVAAIRRGQSQRCARWMWGAVACGAVFASVKLAELGAVFAAGISLSTDLFYMFYLSLSGFHFLHVLLGMVMLGYVALKAGRGGYDARAHDGVETVASYWPMVDLVWVVLFPLLYLLR